MSYRFSSYEEFSGMNMVWITNNVLFLVYYTQLELSKCILMVSLMNSSIKYSFASMSISRVSACNSGSDPGWYSSYLSRCLWGDRISVYPMTCLSEYHFSVLLQLFLLWFNPPVWESCQKLKGGIEGLVCPLLRMHVDSIRSYLSI